jgi:peptidoglycan hydrolase-like amidase
MTRLKQLSVALLFFLCEVNTLLAGANMPPQVRVSLFQAHTPFRQLVVLGPFQVVRPGSKPIDSKTMRDRHYTIKVVNQQVSLCNSIGHCEQSPRLILKPALRHTVTIGPNLTLLRQYSGKLEIGVLPNGSLQITNQLPTREYVVLVVSSETPTRWPQEALKAQAVLTQTRLLKYQLGDTLNDSTQFEAYLGKTHYRSEVRQAVASVWGQALTFNNRPIVPFYHASCGGHTSSSAVFGNGQNLPGIIGVPCHACRLSVFEKSTISRMPLKTYQQALPAGLPKVERWDEAGRPLWVKFPNRKSESGYHFWLQLGQRLGWGKAPGLRFSWIRQGDWIQFTSTGAGHGVGLCQHGAATMARQGISYRDILHYYFPKTVLTGDHL